MCVSDFVISSNRLLFGLFLFYGSYSHAVIADKGSVGAYKLDEIVVTASRRPENVFSEPYAINVTDALELVAVRQVRTVPDALRELSGVMVQKTGHGQGAPFIRGFTGLRTLFLIDGIRLNNSTFREGPNQYWNTVDPFTVQRLELVKGPSSTLYGSDAIGGTVNAITRSFDDLEGDQTRGRIVFRTASAEDSFSLRPEFGFSHKKMAIFAGISLKDFGDLRAGGGTGRQPKTGYQERDADAKLQYALSATSDITIAAQHVVQDDAWRVHKTIYGESWRGTTVGNELRRSLDQERSLAYLQYRVRNLKVLHGGNLTVSLSHHQQDEDRLRIKADGNYDQQGTTVGTFGLWGQVEIPSEYGTWTVGVEAYRDSVDSFRNDYDVEDNLLRSRVQGPVADDASYALADAYVQNQMNIGEGSELVAGVRLTSARASADSVQDPTTGERMSSSDNWSDVTASLRLGHRLGNDGRTRLFAGVSQGFRAPNLSDLTRFDSARSNEIETPVPGLEPEHFTNIEVGVKYDSGSLTGQVAFFHTIIDGMIVRTPTGRVIDGENEITKQNSGDGYVNGLEMQLRYSVSEMWQLFGNLTWLRGEVDTFPDAARAREPLDRQMPPQLYLGGRWQHPQDRMWFEALLSIVEEQDRLSSRDRADTDRIPVGGTPGYSYFTLRGGWRIQNDWRLSIAAENILDENYRTHGSGLNEPGRNLVLSVIHEIH